MSTCHRIAIVAAVATLALAAACGGNDDEASTSGEHPAGTTTVAPPASSPPATTAGPSTLPPTTEAPPPVPSADLRQGDRGDPVRDLQDRLSELGYWLGEPDGMFGDGTHHAVVALQKAAGLARDGVVGPATRAALGTGIRPAARSTSGLVVEIDLVRQLLMVVRDGHVEATFDTSTARVAGSTPDGQWQTTREIDGYRQSRLGLLCRPKYFYEGVAVHGYTSVPPQPASHGCVRLTYAAMDQVWSAGLMPVGTPVWLHGLDQPAGFLRDLIEEAADLAEQPAGPDAQLE